MGPCGSPRARRHHSWRLARVGRSKLGGGDAEGADARVNLEVNHAAQTRARTHGDGRGDPGSLKRVGSCFMSGTAARGGGEGALRVPLAQVSPDSSAGEFDGVGNLHSGAR